MKRPRRSARYAAIAVLAVLAASAALLLMTDSGTTRSVATRPGNSEPTTTARHVVEPAGATPSKSAQMVCSAEAAKDIASALGAPAVQPLAPIWEDHVYSCRYVYPNGAMVLSVKELSSRAETDAYFAGLRKLLGQRQWLKGVAQGAFITAKGSEVVRKDYKVLLVDTTGLPDSFGSPPGTRSNTAVSVGLTILGCWTGA